MIWPPSPAIITVAPLDTSVPSSTRVKNTRHEGGPARGANGAVGCCGVLHVNTDCCRGALPSTPMDTVRCLVLSCTHRGAQDSVPTGSIFTAPPTTKQHRLGTCKLLVRPSMPARFLVVEPTSRKLYLHLSSCLLSYVGVTGVMIKLGE